MYRTYKFINLLTIVQSCCHSSYIPLNINTTCMRKGKRRTKFAIDSQAQLVTVTATLTATLTANVTATATAAAKTAFGCLAKVGAAAAVEQG